jgi:hypothetical protein
MGMTARKVLLIVIGVLLAFGFGIYFGARNSEQDVGNHSTNA